MNSLLPSPLVDIPFEHRHTCWFCAEPSKDFFSYLKQTYTPHPSLSVPACSECLRLAKQHSLTSIWDCREAVKDALLKRYRKHLAIGINWTEEELQESEFDETCKIFGGFKKSAWPMYQIAQQRVNAKGWPLHLDGVPLNETHYQLNFSFDGLHFSSIYQAITHYSEAFALDKAFITNVIEILGREKFGFAIRLGRIHIASSKKLKQQIVKELTEEGMHPQR